MVQSADKKSEEKSEREAKERSARRAEEAAIVTALQETMEPGEQLLGFTRGRIAGGWRGKWNVGVEAFFAPVVNIGLSERRLIIQHVHSETGKPSEILPHFFPLGEVLGMAFSDIETFGAEVAGRLTMRLNSEQHVRIRLKGKGNFESAETLVEVFRSLTALRKPAADTTGTCPACSHLLDGPFKFCPYCGAEQEMKPGASAPQAENHPTGAEQPDTTSGTSDSASTAESEAASFVVETVTEESFSVVGDADIVETSYAPEPEVTVETAPETVVSQETPEEALDAPLASFATPPAPPAEVEPLPLVEENLAFTEPAPPVPAEPVSAPPEAPEVPAFSAGSEETKSHTDFAPVPEPAPVEAVAEVPAAPAPPAADAPPTEERIAALLNEILGENPLGGKPAMPEQPASPKGWRVHVHIDNPQMQIDDTFVGATADDIVSQLKAQAMKKLPLPLRMVFGSMSNITAVQELTRRYNQTHKANLPIPTSCEEFLEMAETMGYGRVERI